MKSILLLLLICGTYFHTSAQSDNPQYDKALPKYLEYHKKVEQTKH